MPKGVSNPKIADGRWPYLLSRGVGKKPPSAKTLIKCADEWDFSEVLEKERPACCMWELFRENKTFMTSWSDCSQSERELNLELTLLLGSQFIDTPKSELNYLLSWIPYRVVLLMQEVGSPLPPWLHLDPEKRDKCSEQASCPGVQDLTKKVARPWFDATWLANSTYWYERFNEVPNNDKLVPDEVPFKSRKRPKIPYLTEAHLLLNTYEHSHEQLVKQFETWLESLPENRRPKKRSHRGRQKKETDRWLYWIAASRLLEKGISSYGQIPLDLKERFSKSYTIRTGNQSFEKLRNKVRDLAFEFTIPDSQKK